MRILALLLLAGCAPPPSVAPGGGASEGRPRTLACRVEDRGLLFKDNASGVIGLDGAMSLELSKGRVLWVFGDTFFGGWNGDGSRRYAGSATNTGIVNGKFVGKPDQIIAFPAMKGDLRVWPLDGIVIEGRAWMYYVVVEADSKQPFGFRTLGHGVAKGNDEGTQFTPVGKPLWEQTSYGTSVMGRGGWLYLYGGGPKGLAFPMSLARVAPARLTEASAYEYWDGKGWSPRAVELFSGGPEMTVRWNGWLRAYLAIYVAPFGKSILARIAPEPWGPWSEPRELVTLDLSGEKVIAYGGKQHVELDEEGSRVIIVTVNTNLFGASLDELARRPEVYWPRMYRVTFE